MEHILIIRGGKKGVEEKDIALHSIPFDLIRFDSSFVAQDSVAYYVSVIA